MKKIVFSQWHEILVCLRLTLFGANERVINFPHNYVHFGYNVQIHYCRPNEDQKGWHKVHSGSNY